MMGSCFGNNFKISIFGQSHSAAIGVVIDGLPSGPQLDFDAIRAFMERRAPGRSKLSTPRREADDVEILSGLVDGRLCGAPLSAIIRNGNTRPGDYDGLKRNPRPGHADYTAQVKFGGYQDPTGGGHFSGRLTAPMCFAGAVCMNLLKNESIRIGAHVLSIEGEKDEAFDSLYVSGADFDKISSSEFPTISLEAGNRMKKAIECARSEGDSVGGIVECAITGIPAGIGEPMYDGLENLLARTVFAVPAVRGIEFGAGFAAAQMRGSVHNDPFIIENGIVRTRSNNHGGILGGISTGMPIIFRVAIKPTPSIFVRQDTVDLEEMKCTELKLKGRHDPCIVPRAVPCIEAASALAIYDAWLSNLKYTMKG